MKLTASYIDNLKCPEGKDDVIIWDSEISGCGVRVRDSGRKTYVFQYRTLTGVRRRLKIGRVAGMDLQTVRRVARMRMSEVDQGRDPIVERQEKRNTLSVSELCDRYTDDLDLGRILHKGKPKKATTIYNDKGRIRRHIKPLLGKMAICDVEQADVDQMYQDIVDGKTRVDEKTGRHGRAIVTGGAGTAAKAVTLLSAIFNYGKRKGYCKTNPCEGVQVAADCRRTRSLTPEEYKKLGLALGDWQSHDLAEPFFQAIWALALTGCRKSEILRLRPSEVRPDLLGLNLSDTKTGAQLRPCGQAALTYLAAITFPDSAWVFPSPTSEGPIVKIDKALKRVCDAAGLKDVTCHTLRHSYATVAGALNYSDFTIGTLLGHSKRSVTSGYVHAVDQVIAAAANNVSAEIAMRMGLSLSPAGPKDDEISDIPGASAAANDAAETEYISFGKWGAA